MRTGANLKIWLFLTVFLPAMASPATGKTIFVDADATGADNGSSWADAFNYLQDAITTASPGEEIRVAQGIYKPNQGLLPIPVSVSTGSGRGGGGGTTDIVFKKPNELGQEATFNLKNDVTIKGGFAGFGEDNPNAQDIDSYETILSGDLNNDDVPYFAGRADNSYHVVTVYQFERTTLNGLSIRGGNANGLEKDGCGGGIYSYNGWKLTLSRCTITDNFAESQGGGMCNNDCRPTLVDCRFIGNRARGEGGALSNLSSNSYNTLIVENCTFTDNISDRGGAIFSMAEGMTVRSCTFNWNFACQGGAISNERSDPDISQCIFEWNWAAEGGGLYNFDSSPTVTDCSFSFNDAQEGGGIANYESDLVVSLCTFAKNNSNESGGGMSNRHSSPTLTNCIFSSNSTRYEGGGMFNFGSAPVLLNCTFNANSAEDRGGGMFNDNISTLLMVNCILWGDSPEEIYPSYHHRL
jgi:hypothetical protein